MLEILFEHFDTWEEYHYDALIEMTDDWSLQYKVATLQGKVFTNGDDVIQEVKNGIIYWDFYDKVRYVFSR